MRAHQRGRQLAKYDCAAEYEPTAEADALLKPVGWFHGLCCRLTVKLRGRVEASARRRGRTLSPGARGAKRTTHHGTLERLLEVNRHARYVEPSAAPKIVTTAKVSVPMYCA